MSVNKFADRSVSTGNATRSATVVNLCTHWHIQQLTNNNDTVKTNHRHYLPEYLTEQCASITLSRCKSLPAVLLTWRWILKKKVTRNTRCSWINCIHVERHDSSRQIKNLLLRNQRCSCINVKEYLLHHSRLAQKNKTVTRKCTVYLLQTAQTI